VLKPCDRRARRQLPGAVHEVLRRLGFRHALPRSAVSPRSRRARADARQRHLIRPIEVVHPRVDHLLGERVLVLRHVRRTGRGVVALRRGHHGRLRLRRLERRRVVALRLHRGRRVGQRLVGVGDHPAILVRQLPHRVERGVLVVREARDALPLIWSISAVSESSRKRQVLIHKVAVPLWNIAPRLGLGYVASAL
jgi:hypothetical protein